MALLATQNLLLIFFICQHWIDQKIQSSYLSLFYRQTLIRDRLSFFTQKLFSSVRKPKQLVKYQNMCAHMSKYLHECVNKVNITTPKTRQKRTWTVRKYFESANWNWIWYTCYKATHEAIKSGWQQTVKQI